MSADMERTLFLILLSGMSTLVSGLSRQYHFVNDTKTWAEAQSYCRQNYTDLATIINAGDMTMLTNMSSGFTGEAWIGLYDDLNSFMWAISDTRFYDEVHDTTEFRNWDSEEPNDNGGRELCVEMNTAGAWNDRPCYDKVRSVCYDGRENASLTYVLVTELKTWNEALRYCREFHTDLVSVRNQTENKAINNVNGGASVWIGLYRPKVWSDGIYSSFRLWVACQPAFSGASCTAVSFSDSGKWTDKNCGDSLPFFCYNALQLNATSSPSRVPAPSPPFNSTTPTSVSVTSPMSVSSAATTAPSTTKTAAPAVPEIKLEFKLWQNFSVDLKNLSSPSSQSLANEVVIALNTVFKKRFGSSFNSTEITGFRQGSIVVESVLIFVDISSVPEPTAVAQTMVAAMHNKRSNFSLQFRSLDTASIAATRVIPVLLNATTTTTAAPAVSEIKLEFNLSPNCSLDTPLGTQETPAAALTTKSTAPTTDLATTPQVTTERTTNLDETTIPPKSALKTKSTAPTNDLATTPQVTTERTTTLDETTIPQKSALKTKSTAPTTDLATAPQVTTERTTTLDETTIPQTSALTTTSMAPTTEQATTPQVTTEHTTILDEATPQTSVYRAVLRTKLSSEAPLTEEYISSVVLQQLREELIRRGLPEDFTIDLRDKTSAHEETENTNLEAE